MSIEQLLIAVGIVILAFQALRINALKKKLQALLSQKKSSEVRGGKVAETLAPLLDEFPVDIRKEGSSTIFLGQPIDYIHFDPDEGITFIEVKSGDSRLSASQRRIREAVAEGNVSWAEVKIK